MIKSTAGVEIEPNPLKVKKKKLKTHSRKLGKPNEFTIRLFCGLICDKKHMNQSVGRRTL